MTKEKLPPKKFSSYLKYSGLAFQLALVVFIGIFLGKKIDNYLELKKPIATMLLVLLLFVGYMYRLYVDIMSNK